MIRSGISQIGGKFRLTNTLLKNIPRHEFFLSPFCGACWLELNKKRSRYECFNDLNAEIINYLLMIREHPKEFDDMKKGVFGLVSQEICNRIVRGEILPKNNIERASRSITTKHRCNEKINVGYFRRLTVRECARLQSFPDSFLFFGALSNQYKFIGNAVCPALSRALAKAIKNKLKNS